jgi:hypothetical protein
MESQTDAKAVKEVILDEDPVIPGQEWFCVSFLSPKRARNTNSSAFKFRGAFATEDLARAHAENLSKNIDPNFHIFIGQSGKWILYDPDAEKVKDQHYHEEELNNLMKMAVEEREENKQEAESRKKKLVDEGKVQLTEQHRANKIKERLQKKKAAKEAAKKEEQPAPPVQDVMKEHIELDENAKKIEDEKRKLMEREQKIKNMRAAFERLKEQKK